MCVTRLGRAKSLGPLVSFMRRLSSTASARRALCVASEQIIEPIRLYRLKQIKLLRAVLRVKIVQLSAGVGVFLPTASIVANGGLPSLAEGGMVAAVVGGTLAAGSTLSWYCERIVGELNWLPAQKALRISTLTMWGRRCDVDVSLDEMKRDGFRPPAASDDDGPGGEFPSPGFAPLTIGDKTYLCVWGQQHVLHPEAMARLLKRDELPCDEDGVLAAVVRTSRPAPKPDSEEESQDIRFF